MADKNETKIETLYLNYNTKTSQQSKIQSSAKSTNSTSFREVDQIRNIHKICEEKNINN